MVLDARERVVKVRTITLIARSVGVLGVVVSIGGEWGHVSALDPVVQMGALMMIVGFVSLPRLAILLAMCAALAAGGERRPGRRDVPTRRAAA